MNLSLRTQQIIYALLIGLVFLNVPLYFLFVQPEVEADVGESAKIDQARLQASSGRCLPVPRADDDIGIERPRPALARIASGTAQSFETACGKRPND